MKKLPFVSLVAALAVAACGGSIGVDPITRGADGTPGGSNASNDPGAPTNGDKTPDPVAPVAPYTGDVTTNDVSILYPMPGASESKAFLRPTDSGVHGELLPKMAFEKVVPGDKLERTTSVPSGYGEMALISLRLDHCSARKGAGTCTSEVRAVFQAVYEKTDSAPDNDPSVGSAAQDGALHVMYDVGEAELIVMMKQILTLRKANGDLTSARLEVHPILAQQGLGGAFAQGLKSIVLEHVGGDRIARITKFDHNLDPDSDGWTFESFDRTSATVFPRNKIPTLGVESLTVAGSSAFLGPFGETMAFSFMPPAVDSVEPLVKEGRPAKFDPKVASELQPAFQNAIRVQNPTIHNAETTDCGNCHLAEGAHLIAENVYALKATNEFTAAGGTSYLLERSSVTNLHAFGYLHRKVSIMQRTANESTVVRDWMDQKVK